MRLKVLRLGGLICASLTLAPGAHAQQQQPFYEFRACSGDISSLALAAIPDGNSYAVDIFDPTEAALKFRDIFLAELADAGKLTSEDGNLVFSFRAESIFSGITSRLGINPSPRDVDSPSRAVPRSDEDETRELIRSDRRGRRDLPTASEEILVEAELRNKESQRVLWTGTIRCMPLTADRNLLMKFVSEVFVANMGLALRQQPF